MKNREQQRRKIIPILTLLIVIAITVGILLYPEDVFKKIGIHGYWLDFLVSLICNATILIPIPSISILFAHGARLYPITGLKGPILVGVTGGAGGTIGELTGYIAGRSGRGIMGGSKRYKRLEGWMKRWGMLPIFIFSLIPFLPFDLAGITAGALRFPIWKFLLACWLGRSLLYIGVALAGAWGWELALPYLNCAPAP